MAKAPIALDIETVAVPWEELDEPTRTYLVGRAARKLAARGLDDEPAQVARDTLSLSPGTGRIIVVGLQDVRTDQQTLLCEGEGGWTEITPGGRRVFRGDERSLLGVLWEILPEYGRVVTYNGRGFDVPFTYVRSALHGIRPSRNLLSNRFSLSEHCDLAEVLNFFGAAQERFSLDYWCRRFGITSPKQEGLDGARVGAYYRAGRLEEIAEYCLRDVDATAQLYRRLEPTLIDLHQRRG